jgi:periplasmic divalent cation tolerance protein
MADTVLQVQTTIDDEAVAGRLAEALVEERLAACVQVLGPIRSTYRWQGRVEITTEWLLLAKTTAARYEVLAERLRAHHPYDEPELIALPVNRGSPGYLAWVEAETTPR